MTDKQLVTYWWKYHIRHKFDSKGDTVNLSLIQRPKRVSASSDTLYIYAPSVLMDGGKLKAETIIKVLEVHDGDTPQETSIKVMEHEVWQAHWRNRYGVGNDDRCTKAQARDGVYDGAERPKCVCEGPIEDMPELMGNATHYVLLSDIGK